MASSAGTGDARESGRLDPALRELIFVLLVGLAAVLLDTTIVNVALDRLATALHTGTSTVQWVSTVFLLALGCAIPVSGWAVGRLGARTTWLLGLVLFLIGSVLAGSAWSIGALIAARAVQGLGGGLLLPVQQTLLVRAAGPARLGRAMAAIGLPAVVFPIFGPIVGGLILNDASWRWIFFINVPFAVAGIVLAARRLPADDPLRTRPRLDTTGLALFAPGTAAVLYALSQVAEDGRLTAPGAYLPLVAGLGLLAAFTVHALRGRVEPIIDVRLFARRSFSASCSLLFLTGLSLYGVALLLPLFYQQVRGQSALAAGLLLAPQGIGSLVARGSVGRLSDRFGPRPVVLVGVLLAAVGTLPYAWAGVHGQEALQAAGLVVRGIGLSGVNIAVMVAAYRGLRPEQIPHASSASRILLQVGGSFGVAAAAVVLARELSAHPLARQAAAARAVAFDGAFRWLLALAVLAVVPALLLPGRVRRRAEPARPRGDGSLRRRAAGSGVDEHPRAHR